MKNQKIDIELFWIKILQVLSKVRVNPEDQVLIKELDDIVFNFGEYEWEYGPSQKTDFYFCLSPNLNAELLDEVDAIILAAPELAGWEFISCKPRKKDVTKWSMSDQNGNEIVINTLNWRCIVYKYPDDTLELDVMTDSKTDLDTQYSAVDIHIMNLIGEREYMKYITSFTIVKNFPSDDEHKSIPMDQLHEVIVKHFSIR